ncbi:hypothetical protein [Anaeromyxobacter oryzae]|uniref:Uncharacterized protein n=1 Tax=Anaeromyxobacter oryzae TaxID=2918170 RepID=A0ABM7WVE7_9BACT|nr:hypothetical protein [Anaeromyxobacter oryzae]BDG03476.1 hypothetical protein AMOR_24720 [Anaeromyxobacter oryzae]
MHPEDLQSAPGAGEPASGAPATGPGEAEPEAWARVLAAWEDDAAHHAYLARFGDLEGLAVAGGRYRAVLAERPGDPVALRYRDEVVKRATVAGLAQLPRTRPRPPIPRAAQVLLVWLLVAAAAAAVVYLWRGAARLIPDLK